jgi:hypothetical protein
MAVIPFRDLTAAFDGVFTTDAVIPNGNLLHIVMATPTITSATKNDTTGSLAAGVYKITVVSVDPGEGVTLYPTALSATCAGGTSQIVVVYVAPVGAVKTRVYVTLPDGATPDRYFESTSATTYAFTTVSGATVAALPTTANAYRASIGGATNWYGAQSLFPAGTAAAPSISFGNDPDSGIVSTGDNAFSIVTNGSPRLSFQYGFIYSNTSLLWEFGATSGIGLSDRTYSPTYVNIGGGTVMTNAQPALNVAQTMNAAVAFTGILGKFTEGASGTASLTRLLDLHYGTSGAEASKFYVSKTGYWESQGGGLVNGNLTITAYQFFNFYTRGKIWSDADSSIRFSNYANDGFSYLNFGLATSSFIQLAVETAAGAVNNTLIVRAADGSSKANLNINGQYWSTPYRSTTGSTSHTIDFNNGNEHFVTLAHNIATLTLSNPKDGGRYLIKFTQSSAATYTVAWPATVLWIDGVAPVITTAGTAKSAVTLVWDATQGNYLATFGLDFKAS